MSIFEKIKIFLHSSVAIANVVAVILLWSSVLSDRVSPSIGFIPVYIGMALPVWVLLNLCFIVYWLLTKRKLIALLSIVAISVSFPKIWTFCPMNFTGGTSQIGEFKVLSYNVSHFNNCKKNENNENNILNYLKASGADILVLQEFSWSEKREFLQKKEILKALSDYPYYKIQEIESHTVSWYKGGLAIFSKFPILKSEKIDVESIYNGAFRCDINICGQTLHLYNLHLESNKLTAHDRETVHNLFDEVTKVRIKYVGGLLRNKFGIASSLRAEQAEVIAQNIRKQDGSIMVCGDFNDTPLSYAYRQVKGNMNDAFVDTGLGLGITYNQNRFYFRIDHMLYSDPFVASQCRIDTVKLSDHYPISSYFSFQK